MIIKDMLEPICFIYFKYWLTRIDSQPGQTNYYKSLYSQLSCLTFSYNEEECEVNVCGRQVTA